MEHIEFPKWKYQGATAKLVHNTEEEAALGDGWGDQPSDASAEPEVDPRDAEIEALRAALAEAQTKGKKATAAA
jgi:hypothetical protein